MTEPIGGLPPSAAHGAKRDAGVRVGIAITAALAPLLTCAVTGVGTLAAQGAELGQAIQEGGGLTFFALGLALLAALVGGVLIGLGASLRVPSVVAVALGSLAWIAGVGAARVGMSMVVGAVSAADSESVPMLMAMGISEAVQGRILGGTAAAAVLGGTGLGLAIASFGMPGEKRSVIGALPGLLLGVLPLAALFLVLPSPFAGALGVMAFIAMAALTCGVAGAGAGGDALGRSSALAAAAPAAAWLSVAAATSTLPAIAERDLFSALASMTPDTRASALVIGAEELSQAALASWLVPALLVPAVIALAVWSATRRTPSAGAVAGALVMVVWCAIPPVMTLLAAQATEREVREALAPPWANTPGFEPMVIDRDYGDSGRPDILLSATSIGDREGSTPLGADVRSAVAARVRIRPRGWDDVPGLAQGSVALAIDAHTPSAVVEAALLGLRDAGVGQVVLVGVGAAEMPAGLPAALGALASRTTSVSFGLAARIIDAPSDVEVLEASRAPGGLMVGHEVFLASAAPAAEPRELIAVLSTDSALPAMVEAALAAERGGFDLVLLLPGELVPPRPTDERADTGTIGLGSLGTIGHRSSEEPGAHGDAAVRTGDADVRGSLSREVIRRVIRRHINEVRVCYERGLALRPALEGRVTVSFIISPTGAVQTAMVSDSTLADAAVESCVTTAVRRWVFPAPDGGGVVGVNYPFVFTASP